LTLPSLSVLADTAIPCFVTLATLRRCVGTIF